MPAPLSEADVCELQEFCSVDDEVGLIPPGEELNVLVSLREADVTELVRSCAVDDEIRLVASGQELKALVSLGIIDVAELDESWDGKGSVFAAD